MAPKRKFQQKKIFSFPVSESNSQVCSGLNMDEGSLHKKHPNGENHQPLPNGSDTLL